MFKPIATCFVLALATTVLAPLEAGAVPLNATAKATAQYEALVAGGTFTANVPSTASETTPISIGDVVGGVLATPTLNCAVPGTFCIFGGFASATAIANDGHIRTEASVGPFSVDIVVATPGVLIVNALTEDSFTLVSPIPPGGAASASAEIEEFTLIGLPGEPIDFSVDVGDPARFELPVGTYVLVWSGLAATAEARQGGDAVPAPASIFLLGATLAGFSMVRASSAARS